MVVHRYLAAASVMLLAMSSGRAYAQGFEGLDLTDGDKKEEKKDPPKDELDLSAPDKPATKKAAPKDDGRKPLKPDQPAVERDVTQDDRVKSVQRKLYIKRGRFELAPAAIINVNDPYYTRVGGQIRAAFYPADTLAIAARFALMQTLPSDDVRQATRTLQSRIFFSVPYWNAMADLEWSPLYGKVSFLNSILHIDGYLLAGGGVVFTERTGTPDPANNDQPRPINPGFDLGLGLRFVAKDFVSVNLGLVNTTYVDTPRGTTKGVTQNLMMLTVGVSLFIPFKSTYREAE
ncbi:MAG: outer membrane beta-barrel domain-containing protein [Archangium sp.]|nr:outer membrane beta-barrel domain-containing protein [Archangium sp.]